MINIDIDPVAYVLLFVTLMTIFLLIILVFIIRQQIYMKRIYEKFADELASLQTVTRESSPAEIRQSPQKDLASYDPEAVAAEAAAQLREERLLMEQEEERIKHEEERRKLEEERGRDPAEYYKADSIRDNLLALFDRYRLNSFTMSTSDGLVISSTDPNPEEEAAKYSYLYQQEKQPDVPNIRLIGVPYKGGTVVGIVKADDELSEKELEFIERDINFILRKTV